MRQKLAELRILGARLLCSRYVRPNELESGLILNDAWLRDNNRQMWRLEAWGDDSAKLLRQSGIEPEQGMLLVTAPHQGTLASDVEPEGLFWVWAEQVLAVIDETEV